MGLIQLLYKIKTNFLVIGLSLIFISSLYSQSNIGAYGLYLPFNVTMWLAVGLFVAATLLRAVNKKEFYLSRFNIFLGVFLLVIFLISLINSSAQLVDIAIVGMAFLGVLAFVISLGQYQINKTDLIFLLYFLCFIGFLQAIVSLFQIHDSEFWLFINIVSYAPLTIFEGVPLGSFQQVNMLATFLAFTLVAVLFLILQDDFKSKSLLHKILLMFLVGLFAYIISLSGSRASLLILIVGVTFLLVGSFHQVKTQQKGFFLWVLCILVGIYVAYLLPGDAPGLLSVESKVSKSLVGGDVRWLIYGLGWEQFLSSPWTGNGLGNYNQNLIDTASSVSVTESFKNVDLSIFKHPHNEMLFWLINSGIVVLFGIVYLAFLYIKNLAKLPNNYGLVLFSLAVMFVIPAMLSYPFTLSTLHLVLLLLFIQVGNQSSSFVLKIKAGAGLSYILYTLIFTAFIMMTYSAWHTLISTKEVVYFNDRALHQAFSNKEKVLETIYLEHAAVNPIYEVQARLEMNVMVRKAFNEENAFEIIQFVHWANRTQYNEVDAETAVNLIKSYIFLKQPEKAVDVYGKSRMKFKDDEQYKSLGRFMLRSGLLSS